MDEETAAYFADIEAEVDRAFAVAERARERGLDPAETVEIPVAKDMADRVQNLLGIPGVADRVRQLEAQMSREEAALALAEDFAEGRVGEAETPAETIEQAVRTAVALLTEGVVAAPIEGIDGVEVATNDDGTDFVRVYYAGPIRSAGGTAQALSVLVADYARSLLGVGHYQPRDDEVERYVEEVGLYDNDTGLQYSPSDEETRFIASNCPICLDGEPTGDAEVSGYRDLDRVATNRARGGLCLVMAEGIALKAPKIKRYTRELDEVDWPWLDDLIDGNVGGADDEEDATVEDNEEDHHDTVGGLPVPKPSERYLTDLIAGRPVFSHPSRPGGFRLRYGRARNHGFATAGVHPATMHLVDDFLATGTQIKTERPGKAAGVVPVDSIEGPMVRLATGEVRRIEDLDEAVELRGGVEAILDVGEYLVNVGEFVENNYDLAPAGYAVEWWRQELGAAGVDVTALADDPAVDLTHPTAERAIAWAERHGVPLHPDYTYCWHDVSAADVDRLTTAVAAGDVVDDELVIPREDELIETLETLLVPHVQGEDVIRIGVWRPLARSLGCSIEDSVLEPPSTPAVRADGDVAADGLTAVNDRAPFPIRAKAPTRIGNRMGRPEKSEQRELRPAVHTLFPIGEAGGDQRDVTDATRHADSMREHPGRIEVEIGDRRCPSCGERTYRYDCPDCGDRTRPHYECDDCETVIEEPDADPPACPRCEAVVRPVGTRTIDVDKRYHEALERLGTREAAFPILKGVKGLMSAAKTPEVMEKGVLRATHGVSAFKDGTVRYDMTDLPVTAVRPEEIHVTAEQFRALGYDEDIHGDPIVHDDQLVELRVQDVILSTGAGDHMVRTANFVDDLLADLYDLEPYYELEDRNDLVGELVFGMAPHTSAAVVGRVVGFTEAAVGYAHPYFHAAKRRNCFHPETKLWYRDEEGMWRYERIKTMVEDRLEDPDWDDFGTAVQELDGQLAVPSLTETGTLTTRPIDAISKHPAPDHLVRIETERGRSIRVTPDHELQVYDDASGRLVPTPAAEIEPGDGLVTPAHLDVVDSAQRPIDLLAAFLEADPIENDRLMIKGIDKDRLYALFERELADEWDGAFYPLYSTAEHLGINTKTLSNYLYRSSIPAGLLERFFESRRALLEWVPRDVTLGIKRDRTTINRFVTVNRRVATLLGYYAAEGFVRKQETPTGTIHQTTFCGTEGEMREFFVEVLTEEFGVDPYVDNHAKITVSGRLFRTFFDTVLDAGIYAHTKRVPDCIFHGRREIVGAFLGGYFSGDGSTNGNSIRASTVSTELKEDVLALLSRSGVDPNVNVSPPRPLHECFPSYYDEGEGGMSREAYRVVLNSEEVMKLAEFFSFHLSRKDDVFQDYVQSNGQNSPAISDGGLKDSSIDRVNNTEYMMYEGDSVYCLTVNGTHSLIANDLGSSQCDGDEDCVMLLLDGLLNFSRQYLPESRGGRMDAPLVMSTRIDPAEIDDEAHNMDIMDEYPLEFYEATLEAAAPEDVDLKLAEDTVGTEDEYRGFAHTHDTSNIALGPDLSAYKTLETMMEKMEAQLELARKLRAVDETDVAERVIESHFLPDLIGNLRAFSRQEVRCLDCGTKYRRVPLTKHCRQCGGSMTLTVHQGSVTKYLETAQRIAEQYGCQPYTIQRLDLLGLEIESVFEDDHNKQSGIADFM